MTVIEKEHESAKQTKNFFGNLQAILFPQRPSKIMNKTMDKTMDNIGEQAWTKLLDNDKDGLGECSSSKALIIRSSTADTEQTLLNARTDTQLAIDQLTPNPSGVSLGISIGGVSGISAGSSAENSSKLQRKDTLFGSFHKQLRRSIKAVSESPGPITRYRQTRFSSRRVRKRVVFKHGDCNVVQGNVAKRRRRYLQDIFTTLVDAQWRWTLLVFALSFLISWAFFAFIWWVIAYAHGDLEYIYLRDTNADLVQNMTHRMCVTEVRGLTSAFLYSIETQHTIGYGNRFVTEECPEAIFIMCLQCITGVFIQAFMVGIVFAKLSRPKKRAQTLLFSRNAVICHRDGIPCLMFRVGDMRKSHIIEAHVRAQIIRKKVTKEGEILPFYQQELTINADGGEDRLLFIWPTTIVHRIDRNSPLYMLSASDMLKERFEVVVMLEGVIESTGMTTQARSSYLPSEILWGHRFVNVVSFRKETGEYEVDYTLFNNTYDVDTPLCSAKQLDTVKAEYARNTKLGLERAFSAGLLQRISSAGSVDHFDPASDESLDSGHSHHGRSGSIPNGVLPAELEPLTLNSCNTTAKTIPTFTVGGVSISASPSTAASSSTLHAVTNFQSINEKLNSGSSSISNLSVSNQNNSNNNNNNNNSHHQNHLSVCSIYSPSNNNHTINNNNNSSSSSSTNSSNNGSHSNSNNNNNNNNSTTPTTTKQKAAQARRLSIKQDQLPIDSIC